MKKNLRMPAEAVAFYLKIEAATALLNRSNLSGVIGGETHASLYRSLENYQQSLCTVWYQTTAYKALNDRFDQINGKADSFTLPASDALESAAWAEARLDALRVPKSARAGVEVVRASEGPSANAYKYGAIGTTYTLRRTSAGHYDLVTIDRTTVYPRDKGLQALRVSEAARDAIHKKAMEGITLLTHEANQ
jgi:hypothetical protein